MAQRRNSVCYKVTGVNLEKLLTDKDETIVFFILTCRYFHLFFFCLFLFLRERGREQAKHWCKRSIALLPSHSRRPGIHARTRDRMSPDRGSHMPAPGLGVNPHLRYVPQLGIKPSTLQWRDCVPTTEHTVQGKDEIIWVKNDENIGLYVNRGFSESAYKGHAPRDRKEFQEAAWRSSRGNGAEVVFGHARKWRGIVPRRSRTWERQWWQWRSG